MEHSALHALLLTGLIVALGGGLAMIWIILPGARALGADDERDRLVRELSAGIAKWVMRGALGAAIASALDLFIQVAELEGQTIFGGVDMELVVRFATESTIGHFVLLRIGLLLLTALAAWWVRRWNGDAIDGHRPPLSRWLLTTALALSALVATSFVSHAAAQPENRATAIAVQILHLAAAAGWIGVLVHLFASRRILLADDSRPRVSLLAEIVRRFSPFALATTSLLALTGLLAVFRFLGPTGAVLTSAYGLTLLVKLALLVPALVAGWINFRRVRPQLLDASGRPPLALFGRMLELEVTAGILVIAVAGIVASVAPPGIDGSQQLTAAQARAAITPDLPTSHVDDWMSEEDPRGPTDDDLRYSEVTHNWSGLFVTLLGIGWLMQGFGGRAARWSSRAYPFVLVPFGCLISLFANPELWILRTVSPWAALTDPILLEHQLGAALVFVLAWLSWRDRRNPERLRPLGYALPVIMVAGSLLLLGHAHSNPSVPDELANLINVQHCVFGACGIFAGTTRWFVLRGLISARVGNFVWPSFVVALGIYMTWFYRELV